MSDAVEFEEWHFSDTVNHPSHYTSQVPGIECKDVIGWFPGHIAAAMKYLWRYRDKGDPIENLRKAKKFIDFEIERLALVDGKGEVEDGNSSTDESSR